VQEGEGKGAGEVEEGTRKLSAYSNRVEVGRSIELDVWGQRSSGDRRWRSPIWLGNGSNGLVERRRRWRTMLGRLSWGESKWDGGEWPPRLCSAQLEPSQRRKKGRGKRIGRREA